MLTKNEMIDIKAGSLIISNYVYVNFAKLICKVISKIIKKIR